MKTMQIKINRIWKIDLLFVRLFFIFIPCFLPRMITSRMGNRLYYMLILIDIAYIVFMDMKAGIRYRRVSWLFVLLELLTLGVTLMQDANLQWCISKIAPILLLALIFSVYGDKGKKILAVLMLQFEIYIYLNFLTVILYPDGFYSAASTIYGSTTEWFFGSHSEFVYWLFPGIVISLLYGELFHAKKRSLCLNLAVIITIIKVNSSTTIMGVAILFVFYYFPYIKKIVTPLLVAVVSTVLYTYIVIIQEFDFLEFIIVDILGKDMTFTNRLLIWGNAVELIRENVWGYGVWDSTTMSEYLGRFTANHCHDQFLQIAFNSGIAGFCIFVLIELMVLIRAWKLKQKAGLIIMISILSFNIMGITETLDYASVYVIFMLGDSVCEYLCSDNIYLLEQEKKEKRCQIKDAIYRYVFRRMG